MDQLQITVPAYGKMNGKRNRYNFWCKIDTRDVLDCRLLGVTPGAFKLYLCLYVQCSHYDSQELPRLRVDDVAAMIRERRGDVMAALRQLSEIGLIQVVGEIQRKKERKKDSKKNDSASKASAPEVSGLDKQAFDFEEIYSRYPRRLGNQGKGEGLKKLSRQIKTQADYESLLKAVTKYSEHIRATQKEGTEFVKMFESFCSPKFWREWIDYTPPPKSHGPRVVEE